MKLRSHMNVVLFLLARMFYADGKIAILQFHGAPDVEHPWVHTPPERFEEYMKHLHDQGFKAIALRDPAKYVDGKQRPADPWQIIEQRKKALSKGL